MAKRKKINRKTNTSILDTKKFKSKLQDEENRFKLEMMGHEDESRAVRFINENEEEVRSQEVEIEGINKEKLLKSRRGRKWNYHVQLAQICIDLISKYSDMPRFFKWGVYPTELGVVFWMKNMKGEVFKKAIKPTGDTHVDLIGGAYTCIRELENTALREKDKLEVTTIANADGGKITPSGIHLP